MSSVSEEPDHSTDKEDPHEDEPLLKHSDAEKSSDAQKVKLLKTLSLYPVHLISIFFFFFNNVYPTK